MNKSKNQKIINNTEYSVDLLFDLIKKYQQEIIELEYKYRSLVENTHEGIVVSQEGVIKFINSAILGNTGYCVEDIIGTSIIKYIHPEDQNKVIEYHYKRLSGVESKKMYSVRAIKKDGNIMWISINSAKVEWKSKPAVLSFIRDITEAKLLEEKLKESEQLFRAIFEQSPLGLLVFDSDFIITRCNNKMALLMNIAVEKIIGFNLKEVLPETVIPFVLDALKGKNASYEGCYQIKGNNSLVWGVIRLSPIKDSEGNLMGGVCIIDDITERKKTEEALLNSQQLLSQIIDFLPDPTFAIDMEGRVITWNKAMEEITGIKAKNILGKGNYEYALPLYGVNRPILIDLIINPSQDIKNRYISIEQKANNIIIGESFSPLLGIHLWGKAQPIYDISGNIVGAIESIRDITIKKASEKNLIYQKECFKALFKNSSDAIVFFDRNHEIIDINTRFTEMFGYTLEESKGKDIDKLITDEKTYSSAKFVTETVFKGRYLETEAIRYNKDKKPIEVRIKAVLVVINNEIIGGYGIYANISERKQYERKLEFLSIHDQLTGLYNRTYYENKLDELSDSEKYPITIISADMDGLKLVNDTLGHSKGDEILTACAEILKKSLRYSDILARIGGDEFAIILPSTGEKNGERILQRIRSNIKKYNSNHIDLQLHLSMGIATAENKEISLYETYKMADDLMYRDKLLNRKSARSQIINTLMAALKERDFITSGHVERVKNLCVIMGKKLGLSSKQLGDLALLAEVHDLGKVGIPDKILFKKGPLTQKEWEIMRQHPEKGYRIALSSPDLSGVADLILKHHERWDGKGYPLGLKGLEIPIECRILSIVDAFDAMTNERPYSKLKTKREAIKEIQRCAGTQFDPKLVNVFLQLIEKI